MEGWDFLWFVKEWPDSAQSFSNSFGTNLKVEVSEKRTRFCPLAFASVLVNVCVTSMCSSGFLLMFLWHQRAFLSGHRTNGPGGTKQVLAMENDNGVPGT
jgi:hypothetical protein